MTHGLNPRGFRGTVRAGGFEVFNDLRYEEVGIEKIGGFFQALFAAPEAAEAGFVAVVRISTFKPKPARPLSILA
jgi:hypothetical protein